MQVKTQESVKGGIPVIDLPDEITCFNPHCGTRARNYMVDGHGNKYCETCGAIMARWFTEA